MVSTTSRASSSTLTMMSMINARNNCCRARMLTLGAFHAADKSSARFVKAFWSTSIDSRFWFCWRCGFQVLLESRGDEPIMGITGGIAAFGKTGLIAGLLQFHVQDALLVVLSLLMHPLDGNWLPRATALWQSRHRLAARRTSYHVADPS
jgi:hypothetical protein